MNKKVLLIEDLPVIQRLYGDALQNHGYDVIVMPDGKSALVQLRQTVFDFVLVDLLLPNINGIEFLEQFTDRPAQTKVIVLTDFNEPKTVDRAHQLGIEAYLIKAENTPSQLIAKLDKLSSAQGS